MAGPKSFQLSSELHDYIVAHGTPPDAIAAELMEETHKLGGIARMQIAPEQGNSRLHSARAYDAR